MTETNELVFAEVDAEIADATNAVQDLEERVLEGDTKVTSDAIRKAREKLDFLGLRRKGAERAEAKRIAAEEAAETERQIGEAKATLDRLLAPDAKDPMRDAYAAVVDSIRNFIPAMTQAYADENEILNANAISPGDIRINDTRTWKISHTSTYFYDKELDWVRVAFEEALGYRPRPAILGGETPDADTIPTWDWPAHWGLGRLRRELP